jgi:lipoyl-dependent peroxiredoxin
MVLARAEFYQPVAPDDRADPTSKEQTMTVQYTAQTHTTGGRQGESYSSDGKLDIQLTPPGVAGDGTNPEQLFAAGWAACFSTVMGLIAQRRGLDAKDVAVTAEVSLVPDGQRFALAATLRVELPDHLRGSAGDKLLEATHRACPYSSATRGNVPVEIVVA